MGAQSVFRRSMPWLLNRSARTPRLARALFGMIAFDPHWQERVSEEVTFLGFCAGLRKLAHGQILQDLWVLYETDLELGGYFVEFGAFDATFHSNTWLLEQRFGWTGLLAEPNPELAAALRRSRRALIDDRCVWNVSGDRVELVVAADAELSTVAVHAAPDLHTETRTRTQVRTVTVPTVSLDDLLDEHGAPAVIDFLSVDTEGTELRILGSFDFSRHRPRLVAVEHNGRGDAEQALDDLMHRHGYERRFRSMSGWDAWYRLRS